MIYVHGNTLMVDYVATANLTAGDVVVIGDEPRVCHSDIANGELGSLAAPCGCAVYDVAKQSGAGVTFADGADVYWDATNARATDDDDEGGNKRLGTAVAAAANNDSTVRVRHHI